MNKQKKYDYVIFHKNCFDGYTSFIILKKSKLISSNAIILPDVPSAKTPPDDIKNKNIIIMDVAYKCEILKQICSVAKSVVFIDHHVTIHEDIKQLQLDHSSNLKIIYDEEECGASLTWKYLFNDKPMPLFVKYIKDNDIGKWKLKYTHEFIASLEVNFKTNLNIDSIKQWNKLFDESFVKKIIAKGITYVEYVNYLAKKNSKRYSLEYFPSKKLCDELHEYFDKPSQYKVAVFCGGGCPSATVLGVRMLDTIDCDFVMMWNLNLTKKEYVISFRSKSTDVGKIAQGLGGGGHMLASACSFSASQFNITDLFESK